MLCSLAFGQTPQGLTASLDYRTSPELKVLLYWEPVVGATSYNVYQAANPGLRALNCPALKFDDTTIQPFYSDNPNPNWYAIPITDGHWKGRVWCYAVTAVVNGIESSQSAPVSITIGNAGYVFLGLYGPGTFDPADKCAGGPRLPLPSLNLADYNIQVYYQGPDKVKRYFQTFNLFEGNVLGIIWHAPAISTDGTIIPWANTGGYGFKISSKFLKKPVEGFWAPMQDRIHNFYTQFSVAELVDPGQSDDGAQCAFSVFGATDFWQNVIE